MSLGMCRHLVRGHAISVLDHCLLSISSLTLTYTTADSGLAYAQLRLVEARFSMSHWPVKTNAFALTARIALSCPVEKISEYRGCSLGADSTVPGACAQHSLRALTAITGAMMISIFHVNRLLISCTSNVKIRHVSALIQIYCISRESQTTRNVYWSRASVCVCVCQSVCLSLAAFPHYSTARTRM